MHLSQVFNVSDGDVLPITGQDLACPVFRIRMWGCEFAARGDLNHLPVQGPCARKRAGDTFVEMVDGQFGIGEQL